MSLQTRVPSLLSLRLRVVRLSSELRLGDTYLSALSG